VHFEGLKQSLDAMDIGYSINPRIVRGLDYYNRTVFEFITNEIGAQGTVCGGGRYDGLTYELGKENICGLGFGLGLERLLLLMEAQGIAFPDDNKSILFAANIGQKGAIEATKLVYSLRNKGISSEYDIVGRSLKAQMKYADKIGAKYTVVIGDNEAESGIVEIKNMTSGEKTSCKTDEIAQKILED
jgi:histidyl-tRNA synthetase